MNKVALCVGIDKYGTGMPTDPNYLPGAVRSSHGMATLLRQQGFSITEIYDDKATYSNILGAIKDLWVSAPNMGDVLVIQWAGHGLLVNGQACLVPVNVFPSDSSSHFEYLIPRSTWEVLINQRPPHAHLFTNLDVCYSAGLDLVTRQDTPGIPQTPHVSLPYLDTFEQNNAFPKVPLFGNTNNLVEFSPCAGNQLSVEFPFGPTQDYYCLWTYWILRVMQDPTLKGKSYYQIFQSASAKAMAQYGSAAPNVKGDMALLKKPFLT